MAERAFVRIEDLHFAYNAQEKNPHSVLRGIDLTIERGSYVAIIGHNGSGKSTLARHLNGLLLPTLGNVWIDGLNSRDKESIRSVRQLVGMVFQNPDNQIVATVVEEDVAFGPENLGLLPIEIRNRVDTALELTGITSLRERPPHLLSGGQKQRVAIAGALAMNLECLVLDEATAMLDPIGRQQVLNTIRKLNYSGTTIVTITHFMEEAAEADRVLVMAGGRIVMDGTPRQIFGQKERLRKLDLDIPQVTDLASRLHRRFPSIEGNILTVSDLTDQIYRTREGTPATGNHVRRSVR